MIFPSKNTKQKVQRIIYTSGLSISISAYNQQCTFLDLFILGTKYSFHIQTDIEVKEDPIQYIYNSTYMEKVYLKNKEIPLFKR